MAILDERTKNQLRERLTSALQGATQTVVNRSGGFVGVVPPAAFVGRVVQLAAGRTEAA